MHIVGTGHLHLANERKVRFILDHLDDMVFSADMACATVTGELGHTLEQLSSKDRLFFFRK